MRLKVTHRCFSSKAPLVHHPSIRPSKPVISTLRRVYEVENLNPNVDDENWAEKVTDWSEFWYAWDREVDGMDTEHDAESKQTSGLERARKLMDAIQSTEKRSQMMQIMRPIPPDDHLDAWEESPDPYGRSVYKDRSAWEMRAIAEKRRKRALMDEEWKRRQSKVGNFVSYSNKNDVRLSCYNNEEYKEHWTEEEIYNLITLNGINAKPENHGAQIENPLIPIDYVSQLGVEYIEETEDFIQRIGHWAKEDELELLAKQRLFLSESDLEDASALGFGNKDYEGIEELPEETASEET